MSRRRLPPNATLGYGDERGPMCVACVDREQREIEAEHVFYLLFRPKTFPLDTLCAVCGQVLNSPDALAAADVIVARITTPGGSDR